jgi:hypothetical protein
MKQLNIERKKNPPNKYFNKIPFSVAELETNPPKSVTGTDPDPALFKSEDLDPVHIRIENSDPDRIHHFLTKHYLAPG